MANEDPKPASDLPPGMAEEPPGSDEREAGRGLGDFVRRAVSVGVGAAQRSKEDIMRAAGTEVRSWLEHLNVHDELVKLLSKMSVEIKAEIRFKPKDEKAEKAEKPDKVERPEKLPGPATGVPEAVSEPGSKPERS
jgi:hypothetical protein